MDDALPPSERFPNSEALLEYLREHTDDIECVIIPVTSNPMALQDERGRIRKVMKGMGAWIKLCGGDSKMISRVDAEMLINDGVLQRMKIPCKLDPLDR